MPVERHEQNYDARSECAQLRAEVAMLRAQLTDILAILASQERAAAQAVEAARTEGYEQRAAEEAAPGAPRHRRPGERHLRIVGCAPAAAVAGRALLRHKAALSVAAVAVVVATVPAWHTAELRVGVPGHDHGPSVVAQAFAPQGRPSSPPGHGKSPSPRPSPAGSHGHSPSPGPRGTPPGHASPSPSPDPATPDPGTPAAVPAPDPDPPVTPAAACTPG